MTLTLAAISDAAATHGLMVMGAFHPNRDDDAPAGTGTLVLLGPHGSDFWPLFTQSPEHRDGQPDPIDRWSTRVIGELSRSCGATPIFPFGGPPYQPFISWAQKSGRAWSSPVTLLVHDQAGLMASYRGALALSEQLVLPQLPEQPCLTCADQPCRTACPVSALGPNGYDTDACHTYLNTTDGKTCLSSGCIARRACPYSVRYGRVKAQSAYHMAQFHR